ncbi:MAG: hypothetical protein GY869_09400 [Planctomycetes bacterium]|nr:hypothetical protein [Planctomycetota bacterium]
MEREVVERLAMDRAGGELSDDGVKLLEEYLEGHPEAKVWVAEMEELYAMCAETVAGERHQEQLNAIGSMDSCFRRNDNGRGNDRLLTLGRWAAVILMALGAGIFLGRWSVESLEVETTETIQVVQAEPKEGLETKVQKIMEGDEEASESARGFWEAKIVATLGAKPRVKREEPVQEEDFWSRLRGPNRKEN